MLSDEKRTVERTRYHDLKMTYLFRFLLCHFPGTPRDVVQVAQGVYNQQHVHARDGDIIHKQIHKTYDLLWMQCSRDEEYTKRYYGENTGWSQPPVFDYLQCYAYYN